MEDPARNRPPQRTHVHTGVPLPHVWAPPQVYSPLWLIVLWHRHFEPQAAPKDLQFEPVLPAEVAPIGLEGRRIFSVPDAAR
jgi:hypothetical protein